MIQKITPILIFLLLISCKNEGNNSQTTHKTLEKVTKESDNLTWVNEFERFRNAILQNNIETVQSFLADPMESEHNDIWYLAQGGYISNENEGDVFTNFTQEDLEAYYDAVFPSELRLALREKPSKDIAKPHFDNYGKIVFNEDRDSIQLLTVYNPEDHKLDVYLYNHNEYSKHVEQQKKDKEAEARGEILGETGERESDYKYEEILYSFRIENNKTLQLNYINCSEK